MKNDKGKKLFDVIGLIALRKADFYNKVVWEATEKKIKIDEGELKQKISDLSGEKFISAEEKRSKKLNPKTGLESLDLHVSSFLTQ